MIDDSKECLSVLCYLLTAHGLYKNQSGKMQGLYALYQRLSKKQIKQDEALNKKRNKSGYLFRQRL